jgi:hypothetical protein
VKSSSELYEELYEAKPGDDVELDIVRRGKKKEATITLGKKKIDSPWAKGFFLDKDSKGQFLYRVPPAPDVQKFPRMPDMPDVPEMPELPDIPQLKYRFGLPEGEFLEDMKDFKEEMEDLRDELKELRDEMRALKKEI